MILLSAGGILSSSGIKIEPKFSLVSSSQMDRKSMSKTVISPGSSNTIVSSLYAPIGSILVEINGVSNKVLSIIIIQENCLLSLFVGNLLSG